MNILKKLSNKLKEEIYKNLNLGKQIYSLHCLNIYINSKILLGEKNKIKYIYDKKDENFNEEDKNKIIKYF